MPIRTLSELFLVVARHDKEACLRHKVGGRYVAVSTAELTRQVRQIAKALAEFADPRAFTEKAILTLARARRFWVDRLELEP